MCVKASQSNMKVPKHNFVTFFNYLMDDGKVTCFLIWLLTGYKKDLSD